MSKRIAPAAAAALLCLAVSANADEVRLRGGDRLTGEISSAEKGKLKVSSKALGDLTVDLKEVETFSTDKPVEIHLADGTVLNQQIEAGDAGTVRAVAGDEARVVSLSDVKTINPKYGVWSGSLVVGGLITRGNSETENLNVSFTAVRRTEDDRLTASAAYYYGRQKDPATGDKTTSADNWSALAKYDYFFTEKFYGYGLLRVEKDRIADLQLRVAPGVGVGYQWFETPDFNLNTEAGLSWVYEDYEHKDPDEHFAARFAYHVDKKFNDKVAVFHNLEYLPSIEDISDFNVNADAGVRATLTKQMFAEFKFEWKFDATPAPDHDKNDLRYLLGVGWTF